MLTPTRHTLGFVSPPLRATDKAASRQSHENLDQASNTLDRDTVSLGAVLLTGLSLLGASGCISPPQPPTIQTVVQTPVQTDEVCTADLVKTARVIIVDDFWEAETRTTHGESVEQELIRHHDVEGADANLSVERKHVGLYTGDHGLSKGESSALTRYLRDHLAGRMSRNSDALREILNEGGERGVIHQSQGASQSRVVDALFYRAGRDSKFRGKLQEQLGIQPSVLYGKSAKRELLQSLVTASDAVYDTDEAVLVAREQLRTTQDELHGEAYIHVISAGNQGYLARDMERLGVRAPADFFTNDLASSHSIIVGASDNRSETLESHSAEVANLASPGAGAHLAADGVDRPLTVDGKQGLHSGSSYAAPQVSSSILSRLRQDPELTRDTVLKDLQAEAQSVPGSETFLGAGSVNAPTTLTCS